MTSLIGVLGAGSWGTALSHILAYNGHDVVLWSYEDDVAEQINQERTNGRYLPGVQLAGGLRATTDMAEAIVESSVVLSVSPSHVVRPVTKAAADLLGAHRPLVVSASKGLETSTDLRMSEVLN